MKQDLNIFTARQILMGIDLDMFIKQRWWDSLVVTHAPGIMGVEWQLPYMPVCTNVFLQREDRELWSSASECRTLECYVIPFMSSAVAKKYLRGPYRDPNCPIGLYQENHICTRYRDQFIERVEGCVNIRAKIKSGGKLYRVRKGALIQPVHVSL